ncbi:hypothetical protein B0H14DRAFT_3467872 [Mycena olivaceomarginata]|nr:hypothetical protein B0H14DRAFT_3467872 [Mycena olivaceomarginata]
MRTQARARLVSHFALSLSLRAFLSASTHVLTRASDVPAHQPAAALPSCGLPRLHTVRLVILAPETGKRLTPLPSLVEVVDVTWVPFVEIIVSSARSTCYRPTQSSCTITVPRQIAIVACRDPFSQTRIKDVDEVRDVLSISHLRLALPTFPVALIFPSQDVHPTAARHLQLTPSASLVIRIVRYALSLDSIPNFSAVTIEPHPYPSCR